MKNMITSLFRFHGEELEDVVQSCEKVYAGCLNKHDECTTSFVDCKLLQLLCIDTRPEKLLEIGTFVGTSTYSLAAATKSTGGIIYTCDNQDEFFDAKCDLNYRIKTHPKTWSSDLLKQEEMLQGLDFVFNDANCSVEDCEQIYKLANDRLVFATHDYYDSNGYFAKGHDAIQSMLRVLENKACKFKLYIPEKEWYFDGAYKGINGCTAVITIIKQ